MSIASYNGSLYASDDAGYIHKYEGDNNWVSCGKVPEYKILSMTTYQGNLYGGASTLIHRYAGGTQWDNVASFPPQDIDQVHCLIVYGGKLYAGTWQRGRIMRYDGDNNWAACGDTGALDDTTLRNGVLCYNNEINALAVYNGKMYAGVIPKGELWRYDGGQNTTMVKRLVMNPDYSKDVHSSWRRVPCMTVYRGRMYCGTSTSGGVADANPSDESGKVFSWEAGRNASYDDDLGGAWRYVTAVRERTYLKLYVDGRLVAKSATFDPRAYDLNNSRPLYLGFGTVNYFNGNMREVRLYKRALNESEARNIAIMRQ
jgi:hypothetical protein